MPSGLVVDCTPDDPALKIGERVDVAFGIDRDHLAARKVRTGPAILAFATRHTKATHDTIELAARQQLFLLFPVNQLVFWLVTNADQRLGQYLDIQANDIAILVGIHKRWIEVASDVERLKVVVFDLRGVQFF